MVARALVFLAVILFSSGLHAQVQCGSQPKIPGDVEDQIKGDVESKAQIFTKLLGDVNLKGTVESSKKEVYQKYKDLDKSQIDQYMIWVSCQNIMLDKQLSAADKSKLWIEIYRELTVKPSGKGESGLQRIEGRWNHNATRTNIQITKNEIDGWDIWLSERGLGRIGSTSGYGANVIVSTAQFECYYFLTRLSDGRALQWQKTRGPSDCPEGRFERPSSTRYPSTPPVAEPKGSVDIHNPWVAPSDVGADSDGFFDRSPGQTARPLTVGPSDVLRANRDINMRQVPAGWGQTQILRRGQRVRVIATRSLPAAGTWQVWAQISVID
jgi:hypothetical protein